MSKKSLNNFQTLEELELDRDSLVEDIKELEFSLKIKKFELKIKQEIIEQDKDKVIEQVKEDGSVIEYVGSEFQNDYDVVIEAVKTFEWALCYASKELQNDYEIVYQALLLNPNAIEYASDELKTQDEFLRIYLNHWVGKYKIYKTIDEFIQVHEMAVDLDLIKKIQPLK